MAWTREQMAQRAAKELQDGDLSSIMASLSTFIQHHDCISLISFQIYHR